MLSIKPGALCPWVGFPPWLPSVGPGQNRPASNLALWIQQGVISESACGFYGFVARPKEREREYRREKGCCNILVKDYEKTSFQNHHSDLVLMVLIFSPTQHF